VVVALPDVVVPVPLEEVPIVVPLEVAPVVPLVLVVVLDEVLLPEEVKAPLMPPVDVLMPPVDPLVPPEVLPTEGFDGTPHPHAAASPRSQERRMDDVEITGSSQYCVTPDGSALRSFL
jgi:hypothetical protein